jgi:hypothetical protein
MLRRRFTLMSTRNYIVLSEDLSLSDRQKYRLQAMAAGIAACFDNNIGVWDPNEVPAKNGVKPTTLDVMNFLARSGGEPPESIDIREFQPILDAGTAAGFDQWLTTPLAAVGGEYSIFAAIPVPAIALRTRKLVVWYGVQIETVPLTVSRLNFRRTVAAGTITAQFDLEQLATGQKQDGYFSSPQIWLPNLPYAINVIARVIAPAARVIPHNFVFEPAGTVSA